ncbi:MAG: hypothetical protein K2L13_00330 [Opitutales bacterium]|nr:hypothetical protein [Opitutales bacterium]
MEALRYSAANYSILFLVIAIITSRLINVIHSPILQISVRWIMRLSTCICLTFTIFALGTRPQVHPFWAVFLSVFLGYFLVESIYFWVLIRLYSKIDFPLFPKFSLESETIVWMTGKYAQKIRSMIQKAGFKFSETLAIKSPTISIMLSPIFYSKRGHIRLQVLFPNFPKKQTLINFILTTYLRNGTILVTHNVQSPASAFFAPPFRAQFFNIASIKTLINIHRNRIKKHMRHTFCLSGENCKQAINHEQVLLEQANLANGNCIKPDGHTSINLSFAGRYQLWINMLRINYIGQ